MVTVTERIESLDGLQWLRRILGWDAVFPYLVSVGSVQIAEMFDNQPPADILALVGLPVIAFAVRLVVGRYQIGRNACGVLFRRLQFVSLVLALIVLAFVDFFIALLAMAPAAKPPPMDEMLPVYVVTGLVYFTLIALAMYPGRQRTLDIE